MELTEKNDPFASLRLPEFRSLMMGRFVFIIGLRMMSTLVGWWIYELTNAPFAIGLIGLSEVIPALSMALYAGHRIDLSEKRRLLLKCVFFYFCAATVLLIISSRLIQHHLTNHHIALCVYAVIFCTGIIRSFTGPGFNTMISYIVPRETLPNATTWTQGTWLSASVTGHAMGGFFIAWIGNSGTLFMICMFIATSFILLTRLKPKLPLPQLSEKRTLDSVREGLRFVFKTKELLGALSLDMFAVLFGGAVAMVPVFARDILKIGAIGFGWLNAASDMGAIFVVVLLTFSPLRRQQGRKLYFAVAGFGLCIIIFAFSKWFILSFLALFTAGMVDGISVVIRGTIVQLKTPDHMKGRVMSVSSMFINSSNELGQFESGMMAKLLGVVPSVAFGGCMTLLVVFITWLKTPSLRKMEY